jgi:hypothetical protein
MYEENCEHLEAMCKQYDLVAVRNDYKEEFDIAISISVWEYMRIGELTYREMRLVPWRLLEKRMVGWILNASF